MVKILIKRGDITLEDVDAIVNPANSYMIMGGGVALALKLKGGDIIEKEARKKAPVEIGDAIYTGAGNLRARYIIHAPTMKNPAERTNEENVRKAMKAALKLAETLGVRSLAFPGMGTGVGGLDKYKAAKVMIEEILKFNLENVKEIRLIAFDEELYEAFEKAYDELILKRK